MQSVSSRIWIRVVVFISCDDNHYTRGTILSANVDIDFLKIIAGVLPGDTLSSFLFIICRDYVQQTSIDQMKENSFTLKKTRRRYLAETITNAENADHLALLANTPVQAESLLYSLKQAARGIGLNVNSVFMSFSQDGAFFSLIREKVCFRSVWIRRRSINETFEDDPSLHWITLIINVRLKPPIKFNHGKTCLQFAEAFKVYKQVIYLCCRRRCLACFT